VQSEGDPVILSSIELAKSREVINDMLEQLGLQTYLFEVEPREGMWEVRVECATAAGEWQSIAVPLDPAELAASLSDDAARKRVLAKLAVHLAACKRAHALQGDRPGSG
jgi:hypothetical protein